jgi:hypothetical protein
VPGERRHDLDVERFHLPLRVERIAAGDRDVGSLLVRASLPRNLASLRPVRQEGRAAMNTGDAGAPGQTYIDPTNTLPCPVCGETVVIAYPGLRPHYAAVRCFEGHFQGWTPWPGSGADGSRGYDS